MQQKTAIPAIPLRTPMVDGNGSLTRPWVLYFEQVGAQPGATLALEVDGTANVIQTLLNLIAGTNVTLTDNGAGGVTIDAMGGTLTPPITFSAATTFYILSATQTTSGADALQGIAVAGNGVLGTATTGKGVHGVATSGIGVLGESTSSAGGQFLSASATGGACQGLNSSTGPGGNFTNASGRNGAGAMTCSNSSAGPAATFGNYVQYTPYLFSGLPLASNLVDGSVLYCSDAKNLIDDLAPVGSVAVTGGAGSLLIAINGSWRTMA